MKNFILYKTIKEVEELLANIRDQNLMYSEYNKRRFDYMDIKRLKVQMKKLDLLLDAETQTTVKKPEA